MSLGKMVGLAHSAILLSLSLLAGCSANKGNVTVRGDEGRTLYAQSFNQAYISTTHDGQFDVILIQDAPTDAPRNKPLLSSQMFTSPLEWLKFSPARTEPLEPLKSAQLRQIVHIHVFWQGTGGAVAREGVVTNAAIDWYVISQEASDRPEVLRYEGAGYVMLDEGRKSTSVEIRDGSMKKREVRGRLQDPLGPSQLKGTVKAQHNSEVVRNTIADLKARTAGAKTTISLNSAAN